MGLRRYVARRAAYTIVLLLLIVLFNYFLFQVLPFIVNCNGESYERCAEDQYLPAVPPKGAANFNYVAAVRSAISKEFGFGDPVLIRVGLYVKNMFTGTFGFNVGTFGSGPVMQTISYAAPYTILLLGCSTIASFVIGIGLGVIAAAKRGKILDVGFLATLLFLNSLPVFFLGALLQLFQIYTTGTTYISVSGLTLEKVGWAFYEGVLKGFFLPFVTLTLAGVGGVFLTQRAVMMDSVAEDYVLMARMKGLPERTVLFHHAFRNAVLPIVTAFALSVGFILSGAVITETVFGYPGLGRTLLNGVLELDFPLTQALFFIIAVMVVVAVFIADILHGILDPRVVTA
jgi:peptide/nickel transport system permease protein